MSGCWLNVINRLVEKKLMVRFDKYFFLHDHNLMDYEEHCSVCVEFQPGHSPRNQTALRLASHKCQRIHALMQLSFSN